MGLGSVCEGGGAFLKNWFYTTNFDSRLSAVWPMATGSEPFFKC